MSVSRTERRVIFAETDAMGIVYYANYLKYFEVGRAEFFREFDLPFTHYIERGLYLAVTDVSVRYHRPARYDDVLVIEIGAPRARHARPGHLFHGTPASGWPAAPRGTGCSIDGGSRSASSPSSGSG
jgi:acyl-CoA thioesterase FadM